MRYFTYIVLILINFILQTTLFNYIEIIGVKPNTMVILIVSFAFMRGEIEGGIIGFLSGLLIDSYFGQVLGLNAFIGLIIGFLCGKIFNEFYKDSILIPFFLTLFFNIFHGFLFFFFNVFLRGYPNIFTFSKNIIIPEALYTAIVSFFLYRILFAINKKLEKFDRKKKNLFKQ
ncbi:rod shape-determining protein MreD [[Clostridium] colinum]|uniref:rod shape-determining protein MreD n=1 Tax=[Clostridium] colinum TaxID=36835 RepID=UPI0020243649|nr:rod shape-determining protein MreD [[Clostridium] colinum]